MGLDKKIIRERRILSLAQKKISVLWD